MFDRSACARVRVAADAHVDLAALTALAALLQYALNDRFASSNTPLSGATGLSRDQNRGEVHATPDKADAGATPRTAADRPVRRRTAEDDRQHAGVVRVTDGDTSGTDQLDNTVDPGACRHEPDWLDGGPVMISDKVRPHHLERKALLYVRQSSAHQVLHNRESSALQYAMRDRLMALGWSEIEVIDDDLGRSAAGGVQRAGFERMVAEVCLGKVGAVAAREVSRFARNSRDWQQLIEMCRVVDTVLIDQETIYAPRHGNDRLLLGLKGCLNEYELDLLRQRSLSARYEKARRGELICQRAGGLREGR
jgi:DNA invertase Pin-like site-specific DNA recombinase